MSIKDKLFSVKSKLYRCDLQEATVWIRKWSLQERSDMAKWLTTNKDTPAAEIIEKVLCMSLCEEDGKRAISKDDWQTFKECDGEFLEKLCVECLQYNGYKDAVVIDAKKN